MWTPFWRRAFLESAHHLLVLLLGAKESYLRTSDWVRVTPLGMCLSRLYWEPLGNSTAEGLLGLNMSSLQSPVALTVRSQDQQWQQPLDLAEMQIPELLN